MDLRTNKKERHTPGINCWSSLNKNILSAELSIYNDTIVTSGYDDSSNTLSRKGIIIGLFSGGGQGGGGRGAGIVYSYGHAADALVSPIKKDFLSILMLLLA